MFFLPFIWGYFYFCQFLEITQNWMKQLRCHISHIVSVVINIFSSVNIFNESLAVLIFTGHGTFAWFNLAHLLFLRDSEKLKRHFLWYYFQMKQIFQWRKKKRIILKCSEDCKAALSRSSGTPQSFCCWTGSDGGNEGYIKALRLNSSGSVPL